MLKDLITGGFSSVVDSISGVIGKFVASPEDKLKAQLETTRIATDYQIQLLNADKEIAVQQASVVIAEAKSDSWLAANWRPITMLTFVFIIVWNFIIVPLLGAIFSAVHVVEVPPDMWHMLDAGLQGYIYSRSAEKIMPGLVAAIKK